MIQTLTVSDVAAMLRMSKTSIYKYAESGKMPSIKVGSNVRFTEDQINRFLSMCVSPQSKARLGSENEI
jgi:PTS system nitrogen regulatory IIA component